MLTQEDKNKIMELRSKNFSYQAIRDRLGFAIDTIMRVYNEEKERKAKTLVVGKSGKADESQTQTGAVSFYSSIQKIREISSDIDNVIKNGQLKTEDRREWEKRKKDLLELLRVEVDDRIAEEIAAAVEKIYEELKEFYEQNYVKKEAVTDQKNMVKARDDTIESLNYKIDQKDRVIASIRQENECYKNRISNILWQKVGLEEKTGDLSDFIENHLDDAGRREREKLVIAKTDFDRHAQIKQSELYNMYFRTYNKMKTVEKLVEKTAKREENIKKQQQELDATRKTISEFIANQKKCQEDIDNQKENIKERWSTVLKIAEEQKNKEQRLQKWQTNLEKTGDYNKFSLPCPYCGKPKFFDATDQEINQKISNALRNDMNPECRIKSEKQKHIILRPLSISGEPVLQSGFSPVIRSGGESMVVMSGLEPVVQSGFPSVTHSGGET